MAEAALERSGTAAPATAPRVVSPFNPANAVTASRFLTLPGFYWAVSNGYHQWATLFIFLCGFADKLDGAVAKIFNCKSAFGEFFDAIADGVCYGFAMIVLAYFGWAPVLPIVIGVAMGVLNSVLRAIYVKRAGRAVNYKSHLMERVVGYIGAMIGWATAGFAIDLMYWFFVPAIVITVAHDAKRMLVDPIPEVA
jgi:phosphatidylglycerophosphate synthase